MGVIGRSRGRGGTQHIASSSADDTATSCVAGLPGAGAVAADPEQPEIGSARRETRNGYDNLASNIKSYLI